MLYLHDRVPGCLGVQSTEYSMWSGALQVLFVVNFPFLGIFFLMVRRLQGVAFAEGFGALPV